MRTTHTEVAIDSVVRTRAVAQSTSAPVNFEAANASAPARYKQHQPKGYSVPRDSKTFASAHPIIDLRNAKRLGDFGFIEQTSIAAATAASATRLHTHCQHFRVEGSCHATAALVRDRCNQI